jgi:hypothetical protein
MHFVFGRLDRRYVPLEWSLLNSVLDRFFEASRRPRLALSRAPANCLYPEYAVTCPPFPGYHLSARLSKRANDIISQIIRVIRLRVIRTLRRFHCAVGCLWIAL